MDYKQIFVNGEWSLPHSDMLIDVVNPATEEIIASIPNCDESDVDRAVAAALAAFPDWSTSTVAARSELLVGAHAYLSDRREELAQLICADLGAPIEAARTAHVDAALRHLLIASDILQQMTSEVIGNSTVTREPIGVVAAITPWNYPLTLSIGKIAYALAAGNTVVYKPSQVAPLTAWILAEALDAAGVPPGVFNLVPGSGSVTGHHLINHPDIAMVSFTGSTEVGKVVAVAAATRLKRVGLELGGKSPSVVLPSADLDAAVRSTVRDVLRNAGQTCAAQTRLVVPRERLIEVEAIAIDELAKSAPGDPALESTTLGPVASATQRDLVEELIAAAIAEGARLIARGAAAPTERGYHVAPAIFSDVTTEMRIHQEEVFGPVLVIEPYDSVEEAVEIANSSEYGLVAGVWSQDEQERDRVARALEVGQVHLNGARFNPEAPFGGRKQSGLGREFGRFGFEEFTEVKSIQQPA